MTEEKTEDVESEEDEPRNKIARGILLLCAIIVAVVAVYTTIQLFSNQEFELSFSPPINNSNQSDEKNGVSFEMDREYSDGFNKAPDAENPGPTQRYKSGEIPPSTSEYSTTINPLIIYEELDSPVKRIVAVLIILEVAAVFLIYRKLEKLFG
jgi:hypothetical protein